MPTKTDPQLPDPITFDTSTVELKDVGTWGIIGDTHLPFHDRHAIDLFISLAKKQGVVGIILNGDILDFHSLSRWDKRPDAHRYADEVKLGREFVRWLRWNLPKARIIYRDGNHEERLLTYLIRKAPELFELDVLNISSLLKFDESGVEYVTDRRLIRLGHLHVIHGHEYPHATNPVNPARGLFLRAKAAAVTNHFHQVSEHQERTIGNKPLGCWSLGCACDLKPYYRPYNSWSTGFAFVDHFKGGDFSVRNLRVIGGKVL